MIYLNAVGERIDEATIDASAPDELHENDVMGWTQVHKDLIVIYERKPEQIELLIDQLKQEDAEFPELGLLEDLGDRGSSVESWMTCTCCGKKCYGSCADIGFKYRCVNIGKKTISCACKYFD